MKLLLQFVAGCLVLILVAACNVESETDALATMEDVERDWVFIQINVPEENDKIDSYYYYAKVSKRQYLAIAQNKLTSGFILLKETRYWGNDDIIHAYADVEDTGDLVFRIEDIHYISLMRAEPKVGMGTEQWDEAVEAATDTEAQGAEETKVEVDDAEKVNPVGGSVIKG